MKGCAYFEGLILNDLLVHDRAYNCLPCSVGFVEECVEVRQKCVTYPQVMYGALHQSGVGTIRCWILGLETHRWIKGRGLRNDRKEGQMGNKDLSFIHGGQKGKEMGR